MATKIKKVEIPIDQRETFVSLQKNFADSGMPIEEKLKTLYELQAADCEIDKIVQLRGELPAEVEALETEIETLSDAIAQKEAESDGLSEGIAKNRRDIAETEENILAYQKQLGTITNSREYDSISKEIENLDLLHQIAEKNIGEAKLSIDELRSDIEDLKERLSIRTEDLEAKKKELDTIVESTAQQEAVYQEKRSALAAKIDERTMSAYERIRGSVRNHLAVVGVFGQNSCGGCFNVITPQKLVEISNNKKLIICEHCGRIIINQNFNK